MLGAVSERLKRRTAQNRLESWRPRSFWAGFTLPGGLLLIAFFVVGIFLFRIRERFDTVDLHALDMSRGESA